METLRVLILLCLWVVGARADVVTAYCPCSRCCGPGSPKPTASGVWPREGRTVAGPRGIPFGTVVEIEGVGRRVVEDRTARKYDGQWDVFFRDHKEALKFGKKNLRVRIVR